MIQLIYLFHIGGQDCLQIRDIGLRVVEVIEELETVGETGEDGELALERVLAEVEVEGSNVIDFARFPIGIGLEGSDTSDRMDGVSGHKKDKLANKNAKCLPRLTFIKYMLL